MYTVISLIFVAANFRELAETDMFVDIGIHGFGTGQITSLAIYGRHCALNFWFKKKRKPRKLIFRDFK